MTPATYEHTTATDQERRGPVLNATNTQTLTQLEWEAEDFAKGEAIARALGFEQFAYTSTSALWGLFCLPENPQYANGRPTDGGCIIKTRELGFLFVQDGEDRHLGYDWNEA